MDRQKKAPAGFWIRLLALWVDILLIYVVLKIAFYVLLLSPFTVYFPFEATLILVLMIYSAVMISIKGYTLGKWLLGIKIVEKNGAKLPAWKAVLREVILKPLSAVILFLGFLMVAFNKKKRGLHDLLIGSIAVKSGTHLKFHTYARFGTTVLFLTLSGIYIYPIIHTIIKFNKVALKEQIEFPFMTRNAEIAIELKEQTSLNDSLYVNWLQTNSQTPEEYMIEKATEHQVLLLGEAHLRKDIVNLYNEMIPDLYHKAGVRCLAMECISYSMNEKVERLVNGEVYDHNLALSIARSMNWKSWGFEEYWKTLETVWQLNRSLPADAPKMRIIGIDSEWNGPEASYVLWGEDKVEGIPAVEKLKALTVIDDFAGMISRDNIMAYCIEKEMIDKQVKGVVLVGSAHVLCRYSFPRIQDGKLDGTSSPRMGALLKEKYPNDVYTVLISQLHMGPSFAKAMECVMTASEKERAAIDIKDSPFAMWRDEKSPVFGKYPSVVFEDLFDGFIYIGGGEKIRKSSWMDNYVSKEMFMNYKPYYEARVKQEFSNAAEVNAYFKTEYP